MIVVESKMDKLISIIAVLLLLSLITEKITNFVRAYTWHLREFWNRPAKRLNLKKRFSPPTDPKDAMKNREKQVGLLSLVVGTLVAFFSNLSVVSLLEVKDFSSHQFYLESFNGEFDLGYWIGCLMTGLLLTFGSKFFHDLLDLLFQVKSIRRSFNEDRFSEITTARNADEALEIVKRPVTASELVRAELRRELEKHGVTENDIFGIDINEQRIEVSVRDKLAAALSNLTKLQIHLHGKQVDYTIKVLPTSRPAIPHGGVHPGENLRTLTERGCAGFIGTYNEKKYLVTCFHCVKPHFVPWINYRGGHPFPWPIFLNGQRIGKVQYGTRSDTMDIAVVECPPNSSNLIPSTGRKLRIPDTVSDSQNLLSVICYPGTQENEVTGYILSWDAEQKFQYKDTVWTFHNLIKLSGAENSPQSISEAGDSGSPVYTEDGVLTGIILGSDEHYTYVLPGHAILGHLSAVGFPFNSEA